MRINKLREKIAELEHEQWMEWSKAIAETEDIGEERLARWKKFWVPYNELPDEEKESDRGYAEKIVSLLHDELPEAALFSRKNDTVVRFQSKVFPHKSYTRKMLEELDYRWVSVNDRYWDRSGCTGPDFDECPGEGCPDCGGTGILEDEAEWDRKHPVNYDGHGKVAVAILITENDYLKDSQYSGDEVRKACGVRIFLNGKQMHEYRAGNYKNALLTAEHHVVAAQLAYWPAPGEKVMYKDRLMVCKRHIREQGCVVLETADGEPYETGEDAYFDEDWVKVSVVQDPGVRFFDNPLRPYREEKEKREPKQAMEGEE